MKISRFVGYSTLTIFVFALLAVTLWNLITVQPLFLIVFVFVTIAALITIFQVFVKEVQNKAPVLLDIRKQGLDFIAVFIGSLVTYLLHIYTPLCVVLASGLVGILSALFVKKYQVPLYCGSFVGMSSPLLLGVFPFILASILAGFIYIISKDVYNGFGGKLGTIALSGALISSLILRTPFIEGSPYTMMQQWLIVGFSILAATLTYTLSVRFKLGPVLASGYMGFFLGAILRIFSETNGLMLAIVVIGASFVGMSSKERVKDERLVALSGVFFGLIFIYSGPFFGGAGGKLGTIAFLSILSAYGLQMVASKFNHKKQLNNV